MNTSFILKSLTEQRDHIVKAIAILRGNSYRKRAMNGPRGRHLSAAANKRISDAQKKRWPYRREARPEVKLSVIVILLVTLLEAQSVKPEVMQAVRGSVLLRDQMRDPDSFVIEKVFTMTNQKGVDITCFEYRSRNGFGGMNRESALYTEYKGKPHVDMTGRGGSCAVTKNHPYVEITKEFQEAEKHQ
jgi:hypothetical protein